jgi:hypothetical protein
MATPLLHTWVCNYGTTEYLDYIKSTRKFTELQMDLYKNAMQSWASNEWAHELTSIKGNTFEDAQGNTLLYGQVAPKQPVIQQKDIAIEMAKRIIMIAMTTYIPKKHTLFYQWLKHVEETDTDFIDAIRIYCTKSSDPIVFNETYR